VTARTPWLPNAGKQTIENEKRGEERARESRRNESRKTMTRKRVKQEIWGASQSNCLSGRSLPVAVSVEWALMSHKSSVIGSCLIAASSLLPEAMNTNRGSGLIRVGVYEIYLAIKILKLEKLYNIPCALYPIKKNIQKVIKVVF
jgi:hypothetical protein